MTTYHEPRADLPEHRVFHLLSDRNAPETCDACSGRRPWTDVVSEVTS